MLKTILGTASQLVGTGINEVLGAAEHRRQQRELERQERENRLWYDRRYNEEGRETAVGQRMLEKMREAQRERMSSVSGRSAVMGGSGAVRAAESAAQNKAIGDTVGQLDANQEARRDKIEGQYRQRQAQLSAQRQNLSAQQQANLADAATQARLFGARIAAGAAAGKVKSSDGASSAAGGGDGVSSTLRLPDHHPWKDFGTVFDQETGTFKATRYPGGINALNLGY